MSEEIKNLKPKRFEDRPTQYFDSVIKRDSDKSPKRIEETPKLEDKNISQNVVKESPAILQSKAPLDVAKVSQVTPEITQEQAQNASKIPKEKAQTDVSSDYDIDLSDVGLSTIAEKVSANSGDSAFTTLSLKAVPKEKKSIDTPLGVYILAFCYLVIFGMGFLNSSVISRYYAGLMLVNLILALSLLLRLNIIRKLVISVSVITFGITVFSMFMVTNMMNDVKNLKNKYESITKSVSSENLDSKQKQLDDLNFKIEDAKKITGKVNGLTYTKLSLTLIGNIGAVVYLTRPRVKLAFTERKAKK